jgi:hypothetical protein
MIIQESDCILYIYYKTALTSPAWELQSMSNVEIDRTSTFFTGGRLVYSTFVTKNRPYIIDVTKIPKIMRSVSGDSFIVTVAISTFSGSDRTKCFCTLEWLEENN